MDARARARLYGFFSRLFLAEVDEGFAGVLGGELGAALLAEFAHSDEGPLLRDAAKREAVFHADFAHLTIVNLVPYESFYRREDGMMESGGVNPVVQFYARHGFEADLTAARSIGPDHLGIELELMSELATREAEAEGAYALRIRTIERELLEQHLLAWAPVYLLAVIRNAKTILYREGAEALLDFLLSDFEALS